MNKEEIIKQFVKEHIHWIQNNNGEITFDEFVADFAILIATEAEYKAWDARGEIIIEDGCRQKRYRNIEDWRNENI